MSLDSVVYTLKSSFKTKDQRSFFTLPTQVNVRLVQLYVTKTTAITCSVKGTAVFLPWVKHYMESHYLEGIFHTCSVSLRAGSLVWVGDKEQRTGEPGKKNETRKSEPACELLIFEFCPSQGVKSAFHMCQITIQ